jgi:hypothetical protein
MFSDLQQLSRWLDQDSRNDVLNSQMVNGPSTEKVLKTGLLWLAGSLGNYIFCPSFLQSSMDLLLLVGLSYVFHECGLLRRPGSNQAAERLQQGIRRIGPVSGLSPEEIFVKTQEIKLKNAFYNITNGGTFFFNELAPREAITAVENLADNIDRELQRGAYRANR